MAEEIRVRVQEEADAADLERAFAARGLPATLKRENGVREVVIRSAHEHSSILTLEVLRALDGWLDDRHVPEVLVQVGDRREIVRCVDERS